MTNPKLIELFHDIEKEIAIAEESRSGEVTELVVKFRGKEFTFYGSIRITAEVSAFEVLSEIYRIRKES